MSSFNFANLLTALLTSLPGLLVCFIGIILVLDRWRSLGSAALPAMLGLVILLIAGVLQPVSITLLPTLLSGSGGGSSLRWAYTTTSVVFSLFRAAAYLLLVLGVIQGRPPAPPSNQP